MHWKGYDPSPMIFPVVVVTITGVAVSVLVKRVLGWNVSGWVSSVEDVMRRGMARARRLHGR